MSSISLFRITFTIGHKNKPKFHKVAEKGGTSIEDAFSKLQWNYRFADKPLVLISHEIIETYPCREWTAEDHAAAQRYLDECEELRQRALKEENENTDV